MKKIVLISIFMLLVVISMTGCSKKSGDFTYVVLSDGTAKITNYSGTGEEIPDCIRYDVKEKETEYTAYHLDIPSEINGYTVSEIGDHAFYGLGLTEIDIPETVSVIGNSAFSYCKRLYHVTGGEGIISIGDEAFKTCAWLESFTFYEGLLSIGTDAFSNTYLLSVEIPASVEKIGDYPFAYCDELETITVDENNKYYASYDGMLFDKNMTTILCCPGGGELDTVIPDGVETIAVGAFMGCDDIRYITIPSTVTFIAERAFLGANIRSVEIPMGITIIYESTFAHCELLGEVTFPTSIQKICKNAFYDCPELDEFIYESSEENWNQVEIQPGNQQLMTSEMNPEDSYYY